MDSRTAALFVFVHKLHTRYLELGVQDIHLPIQARIRMPCVVKPVMSSSGKGQSVVRSGENMDSAWAHAQEGGRAGPGRVIIGQFWRRL